MQKNSRIVVLVLVMVMALVVVSALQIRRHLRCAGFAGPGVTDAELPPPSGEGQLRVALWNVRNFPLDQRPQDPDLGYFRRTNICDLEDALRGLDADIIGFEEITDTRRFPPILRRSGGDRRYRLRFGSHGGRWNQKIALAWDENRVRLTGPIEEIPEVAVSERYKPALVATFESMQEPTVTLTVIQVHLASSPRGFDNRRRQYQALADWVNERAMGSERPNVLIQGDFNTMGWQGGTPGAERALLDDLMRGAGLRRLVNQSGCTEYWEGPGGRDGVQVPSLLDLVYAKGFEGFALSSPQSWLHCQRARCGEMVSKVGREDGTFWDVSDHCPVTFEISRLPGS